MLSAGSEIRTTDGERRSIRLTLYKDHGRLILYTRGSYRTLISSTTFISVTN
jgi:hypothetical protein